MSRKLDVVTLSGDEVDDMRDTIESLTAERDRLAKELAGLRAQEPAAWRYQDGNGNYRYRGYVSGFDVDYRSLKPVPLYAAPPAVKDSLTTAATAAAPDDVALAYGVLWHANNMRPGYDAPAGHARWTPEKAAYKARHILRDLLTRDQRGDGINRAADLLAAAQEGKP